MFLRPRLFLPKGILPLSIGDLCIGTRSFVLVTLSHGIYGRLRRENQPMGNCTKSVNFDIQRLKSDLKQSVWLSPETRFYCTGKGVQKLDEESHKLDEESQILRKQSNKSVPSESKEQTLQSKQETLQSKELSLKFSNELSGQDSIKRHLELAKRKVQKAKEQESEGSKPPFSKSLKTIGRILILGRPDLRLFFYAVGFIFCSVLFPTALIKLTGAAIDVLNNSKDLETGQIMIWGYDIWTISYMMVPFAIFSSGCFWARLYLLKLLGERLAARFRQRVMKRLLQHDAAFFDADKHKPGDLISRLSSDAYIVSRSITSNLPDGLKNTLFGIVSSYMMFTISPMLFGVVAILSPVLLSGSVYFGRQLESLSAKLQDSVAGLTKVTEETLSSMKLVKAFSGEEKQLHKYSHELRNVVGVAKAEAKANSNYMLTIYSLFNSAYTVSLFLGFHLIAGGNLTTGALVSFTIYADYFNQSLYSLSSLYVDLMKGVGAAGKLFALTDYKDQVSPVRGGKAPPKLANDIEFKNVVFSYPTRSSDIVFNNCSFKVEGGSSTCFVAPSGAGKSTVASLLLRSYNLNSGKILIGGKDIEELQVRELRRHIIGIVQQEPILLSGTILENIVYGLTDEETERVTLEDVIEVAKQANCHSFIEAFPDGYNTIIGLGGASLSGGQKQRVAIARALIKRPSVLILDEATSALDSKSEALINDTLKNLNKMGGMTIISIAHRLSTISKSENVIVLEKNGGVIEQGKFITLINDPDSELSKLLDEHTFQAEEERISEDELQNQERIDREVEDLEETEANKLKLEKIRLLVEDLPYEVRAEIFKQFTKELEDEKSLVEENSKHSIPK